MENLFHVARSADWRDGQVYRPPSLESEGFIHLCRLGQLESVLGRFFRGKSDILLLEIDPGRLRAEVRHETADGDVYPHLYGPLNPEAVIVARPFRIRLWMRIETRNIPSALDCRQASVADAGLLATLMDRSYRGTIDHEGESLEQCLEEMSATLTGKYGRFLEEASFLVENAGRAVSACLVTLWKGRPLLAFSMTDPEFQGRGLAAGLIERSISALATLGYPELRLVVTEANVGARRVYERVGFREVGIALPGV